MSVAESDLNHALRQAVDNHARTKGTRVWMRALDDTARRSSLQDAAGHGWFMDTPSSTTFGKKGGANSVWFEFVNDKHPSISAVLFVTWQMGYNELAVVTSGMAYQNTLPGADEFQEYTGEWDPTPNDYAFRIFRSDLDWDVQPTGGVGEFGTWGGLTYRRGVAKFLELLRAFAGLSQVTIPDLRKVDVADRKFGYGKLTLNLVDSNFDKRLYSELLEQVQGESVIERLKGHLDGVARELRNLGLVVKPSANLNALTRAKPSDLPVTLTVVPDHDVNAAGLPTHDGIHELHIDLLRATMTVSCTREISGDMVQAWEVARFKAELTGEEDVLLAYAKAYNNPRERARIECVKRAKDVTAQPLNT